MAARPDTLSALRPSPQAVGRWAVRELQNTGRLGCVIESPSGPNQRNENSRQKRQNNRGDCAQAENRGPQGFCAAGITPTPQQFRNPSKRIAKVGGHSVNDNTKQYAKRLLYILSWISKPIANKFDDENRCNPSHQNDEVEWNSALFPPCNCVPRAFHSHQPSNRLVPPVRPRSSPLAYGKGPGAIRWETRGRGGSSSNRISRHGATTNGSPGETNRD